MTLALTLLRAYGLPIALLFIAGGLYFLGHKNGVDDCKAAAAIEKAAAIIEQKEIAKEDQDDIIEISNDLALELEKVRKANKSLEGKLYVERQKPAYVACVYDTDSVQLYRSAIKR